MPTSTHTVESSIESPIARQTRSQTKELIKAFRNLDIEQASNLIFNEGVYPSIMSPPLLTCSLWHAVKTQNSQLVRELLKHKPILKTDNEPMLLVAVKQFNVEIALMLINAGVDVNEIHYLHAITLRQDQKMHELAVPLMEHGADIQARDYFNRTVLYYAIETEALGIVEEILRRGFRICDDYYDEHSILTLAADSLKAPEILALLFKYGCISIERRDESALAAIFNFIEHEPQYVAVIKTLLDQGVPVDQTNGQGFTALHWAVGWNRIKMVELLLEYGANVNQRAYCGTTPIMLAAKLCESSIAVLLIKRGANIHDCNNSCRYPIHIACDHGSPNIRLLISLGVNTDVIDESGFTPFSLLRNSYVEKVDIFIKHFALLTANGVPFNDTDLAIIKNDVHLVTVYNTCLKELQRMKETNFMSDVTYFDLVNCKIGKLALLTKNSKFVKQFYKTQKNANGKSFLWLKYSREVTVAFQMAEKRRDLLIIKKVLVEDAFHDVLPQIALDKIAHYLVLDDLSQLKKNFYLSQFST